MRNISVWASLLVVIASALLWRSNAQNTVHLQAVSSVNTNGVIKTLTPALTCTLTTNRTTYVVGELPLMRVKIRNNLPNPIYLVGQLDGSDCRMRYPYCYFVIIDSAGRKPPPILRRCGNVDGLQLKDLVKVKPTGHFDPSIFHYTPTYVTTYGFRVQELSTDPYIFGEKPIFVKPGTYKVRFVYSTDSPTFDEWQAGKELEPLLKQIPKTKVESNTVTIRFVPAKKPVIKQKKPQV